MATNNLNKVRTEKCALIVVDMQSDFIIEGAPIECPGGREIIPNLLNLINFSRSANIPVIFFQEKHRIDKIDFGMELERDEPIHCLENTPGVEIVKELEIKPGDYVIPKRRYSGFYLTDLEILLKGLDRDTLIITGVATNVCVYATCLDAQQRDHHAIVLSDCVAGTSPELHKAFLENIEYVLGDVTESDNLIKILA